MGRISAAAWLSVGFFAGAAVTGATCGGFAFYLARPGPRPAEANPNVVIGLQRPSLTVLEGLEELAAVRIRIADVLTASDGTYRGAWLIRGDALVSVNLKQARFDESTIDTEQKRAVLSLPPPRVIQARLDHERTKTWDVKRVTWLPYSGNPDGLRDTAMLEAQKLVEFAASQAECIDQAKLRTETLVAAIYGKLGWAVEVQWSVGETAEVAASPVAIAP